MKPLQFGRAGRPLYGVYHAPTPSKRQRAALILNPWGWEAIRAHRTLTSLSARLADSGCAVLRFDYGGTGDSWGDEPRSVEEWLEDVDWAVDELIALSGQRRVSLVGLRLGALVAIQAQARRSREVDRVVCWECPADGDDFLRWTQAAPEPEVNAFPPAEDFARGVSTWRREPLAGFRGRILVLEEEPAAAALERAREVVRISTVGEPRCWVEDRHHGAGLVPTELIERIRGWITS